jgi:hypothetical protein
MTVKLSKGTIPHAIASAAVARVMPETRILEVLAGAGGAKGGERRPGCKAMVRAKFAPSAKKCIIPAIGALATLPSEGTVKSSLHDRATEVQSKTDPRGSSAEPQIRSTTASVPQLAPEVSLRIVPSAGVAGASTCCFWICEMWIFTKN